VEHRKYIDDGYTLQAEIHVCFVIPGPVKADAGRVHVSMFLSGGSRLPFPVIYVDGYITLPATIDIVIHPGQVGAMGHGKLTEARLTRVPDSIAGFVGL
jgi:hypothetical protein